MLRDLTTQADALSDRIRALLLEQKPALAKQVLRMQMSELRLKYSALLNLVTESLLTMVELEMAAQAVEGEAPDGAMALSLVQLTDRLVDVEARIAERLAALPAVLARLTAAYGPGLLAAAVTPNKPEV